MFRWSGTHIGGRSVKPFLKRGQHLVSIMHVVGHNNNNVSNTVKTTRNHKLFRHLLVEMKLLAGGVKCVWRDLSGGIGNTALPQFLSK